MSQEPKFVSIQTVIENHIKDKAANSLRWVDICAHLTTQFDQMNKQSDPIITEDIDCEVIDLKQLPAPNTMP
jgi:hypothetical protein